MSKLNKIKKLLESDYNLASFWDNVRFEENRDINDLIKYNSEFFVDFTKLKNLPEKEIVKYYKNDKDFNYFIWNEWEENEKMKNIIIGLFIYLINKYPNYSGNLKIGYVDELIVHKYPIIYICDIKDTSIFYTGYLKSDEDFILNNKDKYFSNGRAFPEFFKTELDVESDYDPLYLRKMGKSDAYSDFIRDVMTTATIFDFYFGNPNKILKKEIIDIINDKVICFEIKIKK